MKKPDFKSRALSLVELPENRPPGPLVYLISLSYRYRSFWYRYK
jgi:hypothetical protein